MTVGNITIHAANDERTYRLFGPMGLSGGMPLWEVIERAKRQPVSSWNGRELYSVELPLVLDGWSARRPVGRDLLWLREIMSAPNDAGNKTGQVLRISGAGLFAVPYKEIRDMDFVAVGLEVDQSSIIRAEDGELLRVICTVTLQEYVAPPTVSVNTSFTKAAAGKRILRIMVKKSDTYQSISSRPGIPKQHRPAVKRFFMNHPETRGGAAKLRKRAGKIYNVPV